MKRIIQVCCLLAFTANGFAQNNPIFAGGGSDGWSTNNFQQAGNNIFTGGNGDGWNVGSALPPVSNIFIGGNGDGWVAGTFLQPPNNIFNGGAADGWAGTTFLQAGNAIFNGGEGDGWASTYRPMGPLPVTLLNFDAYKQYATVLLKWKTSQEINAAYFEVERSEDAVLFNSIGRVAASGNSSTAIDYSFTDNDPETGFNYYRLRQVDLDGRSTFTPARVVRFTGLTGNAAKFSPNPTNGLLNIEWTPAMRKEDKLINIVTSSGVMINQLRIGANSPSVISLDMSRYAKGTYFIHIKTSSTGSTQRIILQ